MWFLRRLILLALLFLPVLAAGYVGYWSWIAHRIQTELSEQAAGLRQAGYVLAWHDATVEGFPFSFRLKLNQPTFEQNLARPTYALYGDVLQAEAAPFDLTRWTLSGGGDAGLDVTGIPGGGRLSLRAARVTGTLVAGPAAATLTLQATTLTAQTIAVAGSLPIGRADAELVLPASSAPGIQAAGIQASLSLRDLRLRQAGPLGDVIGEVAVAGTIRPAVPPGRWPDALQRWRQAGGKVDLARVRILWGSLDLKGAGTLGVDADGQPTGGGNATIAGLPATIDALVQSGVIRPNEGAMAKLGLAALGRGTGGVTLPVRVEPGALFLGPARVPLPRLSWN